MTVDSYGIVYMYITDPHYGCVQKFSVPDQFIGHFVKLDKKGGELFVPFRIEIDDQDYVHISEPPLQRISIFTSKEKFVWCFQACNEDRQSDCKVKAFVVERKVTCICIKPKRRSSNEVPNNLWAIFLLGTIVKW